MKKNIECKNNFGKIVRISKEKFFFRPSAYGIILNQNKIVTLENKSNNKMWFPGGGVEIGEKLEEGLKREIQEETGINVKIKRLLFFRENFFYYQPLDEAYHALVFFYLCQPLSTKLIPDESVDDLESKKPRWTKITDIKKAYISDMEEDIFKIITSLKK